jgi:hypothetical protein
MQKSKFWLITRSLLFTYEPRDEDDDVESLEYSRREFLKSVDPLFANNNFGDIVRNKLNECERQCGSNKFQIVMDNIDKDILHQIKHFLVP